MRLIDADALIGMLHNYAFLEGDDRSICYNIIQRQPTVGGWVNVKDRLPELSGFYLVFRLNDGMYVEYFAQHISTWFMEDADEDYGVAYWMPLPALPEGEENG